VWLHPYSENPHTEFNITGDRVRKTKAEARHEQEGTNTVSKLLVANLFFVDAMPNEIV
jgi:hypothetical protein